MGKKFYICHEDAQVPSHGEAFFGPFDETEVGERVNDAYAGLLAGSGDIEVVELEDRIAGEMYINPRSYWMEQLAELREE